MKTYLTNRFTFESAHSLKGLDDENARVHGHSYKCRVKVSGNPNPEYGWLFKMGAFNEWLKPIFDQLDHRYLNEVMDEPTTVEMLAQTIWKRLETTGLPMGIKLESVVVSKLDIEAEVRG